MKFCNFPKNLKIVTAMYCSSSCSMYVFIVIVVIVVFTSKVGALLVNQGEAKEIQNDSCLFIYLKNDSSRSCFNL